MTVITLTVEEMRTAGHAGVERMLRRIADGSTHRWNGGQEQEWQNHILACMSELATAKLLGRYWVDTADPDHDGDVGDRVQVRHTTRANGCLLLHHEDEDDHAFILLTGSPPSFVARGWQMGRVGKDERYWRTSTGRPAFFVPQSDLRTDRIGA